MSNISSLITLKSELNKRKADVHSSLNSKSKVTDLYSFTKSSLKLNDVSPKPAKKLKQNIKPVDTPGDSEYQKTLGILERKSKLYDKLI